LVGRLDALELGGHAQHPREQVPRGVRVRDIYVPDLHIDTLKAKTRDFR
jgi:error-prone DNA polymerase